MIASGSNRGRVSASRISSNAASRFVVSVSNEPLKLSRSASKPRRIAKSSSRPWNAWLSRSPAPSSSKRRRHSRKAALVHRIDRRAGAAESDSHGDDRVRVILDEPGFDAVGRYRPDLYRPRRPSENAQGNHDHTCDAQTAGEQVAHQRIAASSGAAGRAAAASVTAAPLPATSRAVTVGWSSTNRAASSTCRRVTAPTRSGQASTSSTV